MHEPQQREIENVAHRERERQHQERPGVACKLDLAGREGAVALFVPCCLCGVGGKKRIAQHLVCRGVLAAERTHGLPQQRRPHGISVGERPRVAVKQQVGCPGRLLSRGRGARGFGRLQHSDAVV